MVAKIIKQAASSTKDTAADGVDTVDKVDSGGQDAVIPGLTGEPCHSEQSEES